MQCKTDLPGNLNEALLVKKMEHNLFMIFRYENRRFADCNYLQKQYTYLVFEYTYKKKRDASKLLFYCCLSIG